MADNKKNESVLREDKIDSGVTFWTHPQVHIIHTQRQIYTTHSLFLKKNNIQVNGTAIEQRVQFLVGKGLTKEEIEEVKRRAQALLGTTGSTATSSSGMSKDMVVEKQQSSSSWFQSGATVLAAGVGLSQLVSPHPVVRGWWNTMFPASTTNTTPAQKKDVVEEKKEEPEDFWTRSMMEQQRRVRQPGESLEIKGLRTEIERLQRSIERQEATMKQMEDNLKSMQRRQDEANRSNQISSELASIKTLLVTRQVEHNIRSSPMSVVSSSSLNRTVDTTLSSNRYITGENISTPERRDPILDIPMGNHRFSPPSPPLNASPATSSTRNSSSSGSNSNNTTTPASATKIDVPVEIREDMEKLVEVFRKLCSENTQEDLDKAKPVLRLYLSNLIKLPDVPRYRRISTTNRSFKNSIAVLKEHENILSALGFQTRGSNWEYRPNCDDLEKFVPLLKAGQAMIMNAVSSSVSEVPSLPKRKVPSSPKREVLPSQQTIKTEPHVPYVVKPTTSTTTTPSPTKTVVKTTDDKDEKIKEVKVSVDEDRKVESLDTETLTKEAPKSLSEVYEMLQRGEKLPGVRDIPDRISSDTPSKSLQMSGPKPWDNKIAEEAEGSS
jgi:hypothetical protein